LSHTLRRLGRRGGGACRRRKSQLRCGPQTGDRSGLQSNGDCGTLAA